MMPHHRNSPRKYRRRRLLCTLAPHLFRQSRNIRSAISVVASGVLSRGPSPVPPVVKIRSTRRESANSRNSVRIFAGSSEQRIAEFTSHPSPRQRFTSAGPEISSRSPRVTESLIVRMETRMKGQPVLHGIAVGFVHQPHRFHQQSGGIACGRRARRSICRVEINLKFALSPQQDS